MKFEYFYYIVFYLAWPDQSCPDISKPLIELVKNVEKSRIELSTTNKYSGPVIVHCRYKRYFPNLEKKMRNILT